MGQKMVHKKVLIITSIPKKIGRRVLKEHFFHQNFTPHQILLPSLFRIKQMCLTSSEKDGNGIASTAYTMMIYPKVGLYRLLSKSSEKLLQ